MNIGQKIKTLRENNNISIEELAKKINDSVENLLKYENNELEPTLDKKLALSIALGVSNPVTGAPPTISISFARHTGVIKLNAVRFGQLFACMDGVPAMNRRISLTCVSERIRFPPRKTSAPIKQGFGMYGVT